MQFAVHNKSRDAVFLFGEMLISFAVNILKKAKPPLWRIRSVSLGLQNTRLSFIGEQMRGDSDAVTTVDLTGNPYSMRDGIV